MPNQFSHPWKKNDINFLVTHFQQMSYQDIGKHLDRSYSSVQSKIRNLKVHKRIDKYDIKSHYFKQWSSEMAYIVGFITADGNLQRTQKGYHIHIACDDIDIIEKIRICLQSATPIRKKLRANGKISYSLRFSDKDIFNDLLALGIFPRKSLTIKPPKIPKRYLWDYLRGFFDGDGCVHIFRTRYPSKLNMYFYTGSFYMAQFLLQTILAYLDGYKGKILKKRDKNAFVIHFGRRHSEVIFGYMYNKATIFMDRKYITFLKGFDKDES